jgi:hypothetical protein
MVKSVQDSTTRLVGLLGAWADHLYALLDAARDDRVLEMLKASGEEYQSLYEGEQGETLADVAPYLVHLPRNSQLVDALAREAWGKSWGIYLICGHSFQDVRRHFRHFLLVKDEAGQRLFFRFYDPRVLRVYLPTCNIAEATRFFGPVFSFLMEDEDPEIVLRFRHASGALVQESQPLTVRSNLANGGRDAIRDGGEPC